MDEYVYEHYFENYFAEWSNSPPIQFTHINLHFLNITNKKFKALKIYFKLLDKCDLCQKIIKIEHNILKSYIQKHKPEYIGMKGRALKIVLNKYSKSLENYEKKIKDNFYKLVEIGGIIPIARQIKCAEAIISYEEPINKIEQSLNKLNL